MNKSMRFYPIRWRAAGWLRYFACRIMGEKWYISNNMAAVPGNRASELQQSIWEKTVCLAYFAKKTDPTADEERDRIEKELHELAQMAGESSGHIMPKFPR